MRSRSSTWTAAAALPAWTPQPGSRKLDFSVADGVLTASRVGAVMIIR